MENPEQTVKYPGRRACAGRAIGRPVIIEHESDLDNVLEGDIIVSAQTDIAYVPAMHRASAVVTETGGRFSHAAVWAREHQKPTLLQVDNAMTNLRSALTILVNADEEYVAVLEDSCLESR